MTPTRLIIPTYRNMLLALAAWLNKAGEQHDDAETLLSARLAPDMFPLATQVRFSCVQTYEIVARLKGEDMPQLWHDLLAEGRRAGDEPGTLSDSLKRIDEALDFLESLPEDVLNSDPSREIAHQLPTGMIFDMNAEQYVRDWALPQFYFHVMTAYAILRKEGIELGKADYLAHAFPYLRPGTMPG